MTKRKKEMLLKMIKGYIGYEPKLELTAELYKQFKFYNETKILQGEAVLTKEKNNKYSIYEHYKNHKDIIMYNSYNSYEEAREKFFKLYCYINIK